MSKKVRKVKSGKFFVYKTELGQLIEVLKDIAPMLKHLVGVESNRVELTEAWTWWKQLDPAVQDHIIAEARRHNGINAYFEVGAGA